jgi:hypothetical protein
MAPGRGNGAPHPNDGGMFRRRAALVAAFELPVSKWGICQVVGGAGQFLT